MTRSSFNALLPSQPVHLADHGWRGDTGQLSVIYDLNRVQSLEDRWTAVTGAVQAEIQAAAESMRACIRESSETWGTVTARLSAHRQNPMLLRNQLDAYLRDTAGDILPVLTQIEDAILAYRTADPGDAPSAEEVASYEAAIQANTAAIDAIFRQIERLRYQRDLIVLADVLMELGVWGPVLDGAGQPRLDARRRPLEAMTWPFDADAPDPAQPATLEIFDPLVVEWLVDREAGGLWLAEDQLKNPPWRVKSSPTTS